MILSHEDVLRVVDPLKFTNHHLFKQNEQTYKQSKSILKHTGLQYRARCQGTRRAV